MSPGSASARPGRRRRGRAIALAISCALLVLGGWVGHGLDGTLAHAEPSHLLLDRQGRFLGEVPGSQGGWGFWPAPALLPSKVVVTTLETEDRYFYQHGGVHLPSIARAIWQNLKNWRVISGASTIPMQVARLQHPKSRTLWAKVMESTEALLLIHRFGHEEVLRHYLTVAPYGNRCHGVVRAAKLYFDKPIEDLSWLQAAYLAALPQQPGRMSPWNPEGHKLALNRARRILGQLEARGVISQEDLRIALNSNLHVVPSPKRQAESMHFLLALEKETRGSAEVVHRTTLDLDLQAETSRALRENLKRVRGAQATNTAGLVVDLANGDVLASVGSADYFDQEARGAIDYLSTRRSPGSALKPFIYALALEKGTHTAATVIADTPVEFEVAGGGLYVPQNITHTFLGPLLLREALGNSRNIPALRVLAEVGVEATLATLEQGGIKRMRFAPEAYGLGLAVGALPVTPNELAELYTALANRGRTIPLRRLLQAPKRQGARLFSPEAAMMTAHILADPQARRPGFPAGGPLDFDHAVAVKTGTSQGYRDAWAVAFDDRILVATWVGTHDWRRMNSASGATAAAPAAHHILNAISPTRSPHIPPLMQRPLPPSAMQAEVCALSGKVPGPGCTHTRSEWFLGGTEPHDSCPFHVAVALDIRNGLRAGPECPPRFVLRRPLLDLPETYESWARKQRLAMAPTAYSPLCPKEEALIPKVVIREPRPRSRYLFDPDTPPELSTVRFSASVTPANQDIVWLVDEEPVATVGYPHELRWHLDRGSHVVRARLALSGLVSAPVTVMVDD